MTDFTLTVGENTFLELADAEVVIAQLLDTEAWDAAAELSKKKCLATAYRNVNLVENLRVPGLYEDSDTMTLGDITSETDAELLAAFAVALQRAQCFEAIALCDDRADQGFYHRKRLTRQGVSSRTAGRIREDYQASHLIYGALVSEDAAQELRPYRTTHGSLYNEDVAGGRYRDSSYYPINSLLGVDNPAGGL